MKKNERYPCLDTLRGYTLFSMVVYHAIWDIVYIKGVHIEWFHSVFACIWQQSICWTFILLSGFCWNLGKRKVIRGGVIFSAGILVSFVTEIFIPQQKISFGVLTFLGSSMFIMIPLNQKLRRTPPLLGMSLSMLVFVVTKSINNGSIGSGTGIMDKLKACRMSNRFFRFLGRHSLLFYLLHQPFLYLMIQL